MRNTHIFFALEFFTSGPDAFSFSTGILVSERHAFNDVLLPLVGGWWMAEVGSEEISAFDKFVIGSNNLSFSPFALSRAFSLVSVNALFNEGGVVVHE